MDIHIHHHDSGFQRSVIKKLNKIMATFEQYTSVLDQINTKTSNIATELRSLRDQVANGGMTSEQEQQILSRLTTLSNDLDQVAANPENPVPSDNNNQGTDPNAPAPTDPNQPTPTPQP